MKSGESSSKKRRTAHDCAEEEAPNDKGEASSKKRKTADDRAAEEASDKGEGTSAQGPSRRDGSRGSR